MVRSLVSLFVCFFLTFFFAILTKTWIVPDLILSGHTQEAEMALSIADEAIIGGSIGMSIVSVGLGWFWFFKPKA